MSAIMLASPNHTIRIGWLPWSDALLGDWLAAFGVVGVALVVLAIAGRLRWLLVLYSAAVLYVVVKGLFFSPWQFNGPSGLLQAVGIAAALLVVLAGAIPIGAADR